MEKVKKENKITNKDVVILVFLVPTILTVTITAYSLLNKIAKNNQKVCVYMGGLWVSKSTPDDPAPLHRCFTYEELYK